ncbi:DNA-directed RNA polymerase [Stenotrophomonas oahuensis]|uniref:DNA-directed RNA polymerase n=1 Tax=Stenotrophomonas oahuensis TaxID=3003271 RepID=A0ABY9YNZ6_9GAMM|nr:DNA-directed RNA polymerase [Stenotrophomonas sp. A5586]WNH52462.1 T3/T7 RNA polymerase [Stenotrophomonas sp. A5586]
MNIKSNLSETPLFARQVELEAESLALGAQAYEKSHEAGQEAETRPGVSMLRKAVLPTAERIVQFIEEAETGKSGPRHNALPYVARIDPEEAAYLTARCAINGAADARMLQAVALSIGNAIQAHLDIKLMADSQPGLFHKVSEQLKKSTSGRHRSAVFQRVIAKHGKRAVSWDEREKLLVGKKLLDLFIEATGMVVAARMTDGSANTPIKLHFTPEHLAELEKAHAKCALLCPIHLPMVHPPRDWTSPYHGGYVTQVLNPRLVRTNSREYLDDLKNADLSQVYESINAIQSTPWQINTRVLDVIRDMWDAQENSPALVQRRDEPLPPRPYDVPEGVPVAQLTLDQQEALKEWKMAAAAVYEENEHRASQRVQMAQKLYVADRFAPEEAIYFPHSLDFRGRVYPFAAYLNPQGDDVAKGLLQFAEGKPLGARGAYWLKVHIANLFGVDKVSFADRIKWVEENADKLLDSGLDPRDGERFWETADSPVSALAACMEFVSYTYNGEGHVSRLPIHMDGSCSGLQHFSALLRDPVGGAAVNLVPQDKPGDIYTQVSNKGQELSDGRLEKQPEFSVAWNGKFKRSIAKQPTMTLCYAATKLGMAKMIAKAVKGEGEDYLGKDAHVFKSSVYAADVIWEALGEIVVAARGAMTWVQSASKVISATNQPMRWTTPMGLPVRQAYWVEEGQRIETFVDGKRVTLTLVTDTDKIDGRKQASSVAPNYVHSLDGAHLMRTALWGKENGLTALAVIHDSFGTHAADTDMLHAVIREAFIEQYAGNLLADMRDELIEQLKDHPDLIEKIPELPPVGNLNLEGVRDSLYLFA